MLRIGLTQRCDGVAGRNEVRDALDLRWAQLIWSLGFLPIPLPSGIDYPQAYLEQLNLDGFILTGGNDIGSALSRDRLESTILEFSITHRLPVFGVCRGMQFINDFLGGTLCEVEGHVATYHRLLGEWANLRGYEKVNSFHNYAIRQDGLASDLSVLAQCKDGVIEAFAHKEYPWTAVMWHPERESPFMPQDLDLIKDFFMGKSSL